jgi:hypothetical protein
MQHNWVSFWQMQHLTTGALAWFLYRESEQQPAFAWLTAYAAACMQEAVSLHILCSEQRAQKCFYGYIVVLGYHTIKKAMG